MPFDLNGLALIFSRFFCFPRFFFFFFLCAIADPSQLMRERNFLFRRIRVVDSLLEAS